MVGGFGTDDTPCAFSWHQFTRWGGLWGLVPDLEIGYKTAKPWGTKVELISSAKISTVFPEAHQLRKAMQLMMARRHHNQAHWQRLRYLRVACEVDTTGLAVSLPILPVVLACHGRSSEHVGENEMSLLSGSSQVESCSWGWSQSLPHQVQLCV